MLRERKLEKLEKLKKLEKLEKLENFLVYVRIHTALRRLPLSRQQSLLMLKIV